MDITVQKLVTPLTSCLTQSWEHRSTYALPVVVTLVVLLVSHLIYNVGQLVLTSMSMTDDNVP